MENQNKPKIVALLPMKANSVRVKGKNFRDFCGKPLFQWTLDSLLDVEEIDYVSVNTDARQQLEKHGLTETNKVKIRDRRLKICGDDVSMNSVIEDEIKNIDAEIFLMTHTTNPLLSSQTIRNALRMFFETNHDSLFTVNKIQTRFYKQDGTPVNHDPNNLIPTQKLELWYEENSNLYIFSKESFRKSHARIGKNPIMMETPRNESIDIDTPEDWDMAVAVASYFLRCR